MTVRVSTGFRDLILGTNAFRDIFERGVIFIYTGSQPATADAAVSGTKLGQVTESAGSFNFGSPDNGLLFAAPDNGSIAKDGGQLWQFTGLANGTAGWGRLMGNALDNEGQSDSLPRVDFSIGRSGADLILSNTSIVTGATHTVDQFTYRIRAQ